MPKGTAITLKYRHEHTEDAVMVYSPQECAVYLLATNDAARASFVKLKFDGARCIRSACTDCSPAVGIYPAEEGVSFIVELTQSTWPIEAHRAYTYAGSSLKPRGKHFVVSNHDVFHEVLADSFTEVLIEQGDEEYERVKAHFPGVA